MHKLLRLGRSSRCAAKRAEAAKTGRQMPKAFAPVAGVHLRQPMQAAEHIDHGRRVGDHGHSGTVLLPLAIPAGARGLRLPGGSASTTRSMRRLALDASAHVVDRFESVLGHRSSQAPRVPTGSGGEIGDTRPEKAFGSQCALKILIGDTSGKKRCDISKQLNSERFRSAPRTCQLLCSRLSVP
jgi:hypothetical protein